MTTNLSALAAAEAEEAAARAKVRKLTDAARQAAERERFEAAGATHLKALVDDRLTLMAAHDELVGAAWAAFARAVREGDWPAVSAAFAAWSDARLEAAVTLEASFKARAMLAQMRLLGPASPTGSGWVHRYPPVTFSGALDRAMAEAGEVSYDRIAEHPRFVDPAAP